MNKKTRQKKRIGEFIEVGISISALISSDNSDILSQFLKFTKKNNLRYNGLIIDKTWNMTLYGKRRKCVSLVQKNVITNWFTESGMFSDIKIKLVDLNYDKEVHERVLTAKAAP